MHLYITYSRPIQPFKVVLNWHKLTLTHYICTHIYTDYPYSVLVNEAWGNDNSNVSQTGFVNLRVDDISMEPAWSNYKEKHPIPVSWGVNCLAPHRIVAGRARGRKWRLGRIFTQTHSFSVI